LVIFLAIIFFVPLYFAIFLSNNSIFELNKIILFKTLTLLMLWLAIIRLILSRSARDECAKVLTDKVIVIPLLFIIFITASVFYSIDPEISYFGLYNRFQGAASFIFYILFFILILLNFRETRETKIVVITAVLSSFFASLYGLVQISGFDFVSWSEPAIITGRVTSTLGQPNFLASYLLLTIPLSLYLFFCAKKSLAKFAWLVVFIFQALCLFFTYSRAGWLGFVFGLFLATLVILITFRQKVLALFKGKYYKLILMLFGLALVVASFMLIKSDFFRYRIYSVFDTKSGSVAARMNFWQASLKAFKEKPLFGYGQETQGEIMVKYYKKDWAVLGGVNVYSNRAHNLFLDCLLTGGLIGLMLYLALLYLFFKLIFANIKQGKQVALSIALFFAMSAYLFSLMFGFATVVTNVYFWLYLALAIIVNRKNFGGGGDSGLKAENRRLPGKIISLCLIIIISGVVFYQISRELKTLIADHYFSEFKWSRDYNKYFNALEMYKFIRELNIYDRYYQREIAEILADWLDNLPGDLFKRPGKEIITRELNSATSDNYDDVIVRAKIFAALAMPGREEYFNQAEDNFKEAIALTPEMPANYRDLGELYFKKNEYDLAEIYFYQALAMLPEVDSPQISPRQIYSINYERYLIYKNLGELYLKEKDYDQAGSYFMAAYENNLSDITLFKKIADTYYLKENLDQAIFYNSKGQALNPEDYVWPFSLALLYEEYGDKIKSREYAEKALLLEPNDQEVLNLINRL